MRHGGCKAPGPEKNLGPAADTTNCQPLLRATYPWDGRQAVLPAPCLLVVPPPLAWVQGHGTPLAGAMPLAGLLQLETRQTPLAMGTPPCMGPTEPPEARAQPRAPLKAMGFTPWVTTQPRAPVPGMPSAVLTPALLPALCQPARPQGPCLPGTLCLRAQFEAKGGERGQRGLSGSRDCPGLPQKEHLGAPELVPISPSSGGWTPMLVALGKTRRAGAISSPIRNSVWSGLGEMGVSGYQQQLLPGSSSPPET